jgi:hypothetical protein
MHPRRCCVAALALAALTACGHALPQVPSQGGPSWTELKSPHFVLWTDVDPARARRLVQDMEDVRRIVLGSVFPARVHDTGATWVIALRSAREFGAFAPDEVTGFTFVAQQVEMPAIVAYSCWGIVKPSKVSPRPSNRHRAGGRAYQTPFSWTTFGPSAMLTVPADPERGAWNK